MAAQQLSIAFSILSLISVIWGFMSCLRPGRFTNLLLTSRLILEPLLYGRSIPIYMLVLLINDHNLARIDALERSWGSDFRHLSPRSIYRVGAKRPFHIPGLSVVSPPSGHPHSRDLHFTFADHLHRFLNTTQLRWFVRTTEDCFVNLLRLPLMFSELERRYDPLADVVFLGQSVDINGVISMVHGGSGWLMSRSACEFYAKHEQAIVLSWLATASGDDVMPHAFRRVAALSVNQTNHYGFVGSPLDDSAVERLRAMRFDGIKTCPSWTHQAASNRQIIPLDGVVFWHSGRGDLLPVTNGYRLARDLPKGLALGHVTGAVTLCNMAETPDPGIDATWR
jgi:hypothetical protein